MTAACRYSPSALADLEAIGDTIAADNPRRAVTFVAELERACERLASFPEMGRSRKEIDPELRCWVVGRHLILYRTVADGVEIVRIVHGARSLSLLFE